MGNQSRNSGFFGRKALPFTVAVATGLTESLGSLDNGKKVLCDADGRVIMQTLYDIMHVAPMVSPEIAQLFGDSDVVKCSVCFFLEAWLTTILAFAASGGAATTESVLHSWEATAGKAAANNLNYDWIDPNLWSVAASAARLGALADLDVLLRVTVPLFKGLDAKLQQHVAVVPLQLISESPSLPTTVIAKHAAAETLGFIKAGLSHVARQHNDTTLRRAIGDLTVDRVESLIRDALEDGGLKLSLTASVDVAHRRLPLKVVTPHRNSSCWGLPSRACSNNRRGAWSYCGRCRPTRWLSLRRIGARVISGAPGSGCSPECRSWWA